MGNADHKGRRRTQRQQADQGFQHLKGGRRLAQVGFGMVCIVPADESTLVDLSFSLRQRFVLTAEALEDRLYWDSLTYDTVNQ